MRKICAVALILGIILFVVGTGIDSGSETRSYHQVYKDATGTWRGRDVSYVTDSVSGCSTTGLVLAIIGGIGMVVTKKDDSQ